MKIFTNYENQLSNEKVKAFYWDGSYDVYRNLVKFDPDFVAVLDDSEQKGKDSIKVWNDEQKNWEVCTIGNYVIKTHSNTFTVTNKENLINNFRRLT